MDVSQLSATTCSVASQPDSAAGAGAPADSGPEEGRQKLLLTRIEEKTSPAPPPKLWEFLGSPQCVRRLSGDASELLASLTTEFEEAELRAARVVVQGPSDPLRLSSVFGDASSSFVIRRDANRAPIDVVSARGLLSSATPEWLHLAAERADTREAGPQAVLALFDDDEMFVCHRLGITFTSAAGLRMISGKHVRELINARPQHSELRKYTITIPGWQIPKRINKPTPQTRRAIAHIAEIEHQYGYDPAAIFGVWLPTPPEFRDICSAMNFADLDLVATALRKSLHRSQFSPADALRVISDRTAISYGAARSQLQRAVLASRFAPRAGEVEIALAKFRQAFQKSVTSKFLNFAEGDGWDEWRSMIGANLSERWFHQLEIVAAAKRVLAGEYPAYRESFDSDLFDLQVRMSREFANLYRLKPASKN